MIINGELSTTLASVLYTAPPATQGLPSSGNLVNVNFFRIVNESGIARTFNLYLNVNGTVRRLVPVNTQLPIGAAFDDLPEFKLFPTATILGDASAAGVSWTINVEQ